MKFIPLFFAILFGFISCQSKQETAHQIVEKAITYHGGKAYDTLDVTFQFRDKKYDIKIQNGYYTYSRVFNDSLENKIVDLLTNNGFFRKKEGQATLLNAKDSAAYANALNSVQYFALLPYGLQQPAANLKLLQTTVIGDKDYYTVEVSFSKEKGGKDFDDSFIYWFDQEDYSMDYLAYRYHTDGGGLRFRKAYNSRKVEGVIFQDYENYKADYQTDLQSLPKLFLEGKLEFLSKIELSFYD